MEEKTQGQILKEKLFYEPKSGYETLSKEEIATAYAYTEGYKKFLDASKTEREAVLSSIALAEAEGFVPYQFGKKIQAGERYYYNNRGKSVFFFVIGSENMENGVRISAAHIDAPRLDLKQRPVYEDSDMGFLKTHYYGGIKKYQWTALPLALHGVVTKADGTTISITIGEDDNDPVLYINDLLPHLAQAQMTRPTNEAIPAESLNILIGTIPYADEKADEKIKLNVLNLLYEKYGITEADFLSAELSAVPALKARDVGLDRSLIGAYGHDDRVCAYPALTAIFANKKNPVHTLFVVLADKEETGSDGNTGMQSEIFVDLLEDLSNTVGINYQQVKANSKCLSADVTAAFDPNFADVYERRNSTFLNKGVAMAKYTGHRGKCDTSDASAEFVGFVRNLLDQANVLWQTGELGKTDQGGGGTVAKYIAQKNIDVVDIGVPVISMHSPYEVVSKLDVYMAHRAFSVFCE